MYKTMYFISFLFFICTFAIFSFEIDTPDGKISFKGWIAKIDDSVE